MMKDLGSELIEQESRRSAALLDLVRPLSLATRAEIELVRAMRLVLLPRSDPGLEADLWSSRLLQARDANAVVLLPEVREALHRDLRRRPAELDAAWRLVQAYHRGLDPVVLREEETTYWALRGETALSERQLGPIIQALRSNPQDAELRSWVERFLQRLPPGTKDSDAARILRQEQAKHARQTSRQTIELGLRRIPAGLSISLPAEERATPWPVPAAETIAVQVSWPVAEGWHDEIVHITLADTPASETFIPTPPGLLRLSSEDQREFDLLPDRQRPLLFVRLDNQSNDLPAVLREQLEDLNWRHEIIRWSEGPSKHRPIVQVYAWVDESIWPVRRLVASLEEIGAEIQLTVREEVPVEPRERLAEAQAVVLLFDGDALNTPHSRDIIRLSLEQRTVRGDNFLLVAVPVDTDALVALTGSDLRDRILLEASAISSAPPSKQIAEIREILAKGHGALGTRKPADSSADALLICAPNTNRLRIFSEELDNVLPSGFSELMDVASALEQGQPVLLLDQHLVQRVAKSESATPEKPGEAIRTAIAAAQIPDDPFHRQETLRAQLIDIERNAEREYQERFLDQRFKITEAQQQQLRRAAVLIGGRPGFLVRAARAVIDRQPDTEPSLTEVAEFAQGSIAKAEATLLDFDGNFAVYKLNPPPDEGDALALASEPVRLEDRCYTLIARPAMNELLLAGIVREPDFADQPGSPHMLAFRLPDDSRFHGTETVFGPLLRNGELIGVVYQITPQADFGAEGDLAYAIPLSGLLPLLGSRARATLVDRSLLRPNGNWGDVDMDAAPSQENLHKAGFHGPLWLFSDAPGIAGQSAHYQLEAIGDDVPTFFPPNDATAFLERLAAETSPPAESVQNWLVRSPVLSASELEKMQAYAQSLSEGGLFPGLRWLLRGVDLEALSEPPQGTSPNAKFISPQSFERARELRRSGHYGTVRSLALSKDGALLLSAGNSGPDRTVKLWDLRRGRLIHSISDQAEEGGRTALALSQTLFATTYQEEIRLWDLKTGKPVRSVKQGIQSPWVDIAFVGDNFLVAADTQQLWLIELSTGNTQITTLGSAQAVAVAGSEDGRLLAVRQQDSLNILEIVESRLEQIDRQETPHPGELFPFQRPPLRFTAEDHLRFGSPQMVWAGAETGVRQEDKQSLANIADLAADGTALWVTSPASFQAIGVDGEQLSPELQCNGREISCAALSADGRTAVAADYDHNLWVWWLADQRSGDGQQTA